MKPLSIQVNFDLKGEMLCHVKEVRTSGNRLSNIKRHSSANSEIQLLLHCCVNGVHGGEVRAGYPTCCLDEQL